MKVKVYSDENENLQVFFPVSLEARKMNSKEKLTAEKMNQMDILLASPTGVA